MRKVYEALFVLLLPCAALFAYDISPFHFIFKIDPFVYFGYINNFDDLFQRYGLTYYSVRFGYIFPAQALSFALGPVAGFLAFSYSAMLLAGIPLYALFKKNLSSAAAVFAYSALVSSIWYVQTIIAAYVDAPAIAYLLAAYSIVLLDPKPRWIGYLAIGALFGLAVNSNFFALAIGGLIVVPYLVWHWGSLQSRLWRDLVFAMTGFTAVYTFGVAMFYLKYGIWRIHEPTWSMIQWSMAGHGQVYKVDYQEWVRTTLYAYIPAFLALSFLGAYSSNYQARRLLLAIGAYAGAVIAFMGWSQWMSQLAVIETPYYFSFLMPALLPLVAIIPIILSCGAKAQSGSFALGSATVAVLAIPLLQRLGVVDFSSISAATFFGLLLLSWALIVAARKIKLMSIIAVITFIVAMHAHFLGYIRGSDDWRQKTYSTTINSGERLVGTNLLELAGKLIEVMPRYRNDHKKILFWYRNDQDTGWLDAIQSTYLWQYSRMQSANLRLPGMPFLGEAELSALSELKDGHLVLLGYTTSEIAAGFAALDSRGVKYDVSLSKALCSGSFCAHVAIADLVPFHLDLNVANEFGRRTVLFEGSGNMLVEKLNKYLYGTFEQKAIAVRPNGAVLFTPTSPQDHLASDFTPVTLTQPRDAAWYRLVIRVNPANRPSHDCRIIVQDGLFNVLFETGCRQRSMDETNEREEYFNSKPDTNKVRLLINSRTQTSTYLPAEISLEEGLGPSGNN
jgi:hypothetical protein